MKRLFFLYWLILVAFFSMGQNKVKGPVPSIKQNFWSDLEFYFFIHFGPNTFTDLEWGKGNEKEEVFNPTALDCRQWCRVAIAAGAKGIIITAKHHDGFCLWPSKYSTHTIRESKWKNGEGDILKDLSQACKEFGLKFGVYLSPWDRNHPKYGTPEYNEVFVNMMKEIVQNYGPLFEFWWDGANGEGPNGKKQVYDWHLFEGTLRKIAPNTVVFSDIGPDIRWVGNEKGIAGDPNWNLLDTAGFMRGLGAPPNDTLNHGNINGMNWIPAECDVSIRPGWFYHQKEDSLMKSPKQLWQLWLKSVGRGANLLLNVPPDRRGLINEHDSAALVGFRELREHSFQNNLLRNAEFNVYLGTQKVAMRQELNEKTIGSFKPVNMLNGQGLEIEFPHPQNINCLVLKESLTNGQNCVQFRLELKNEKGQSIRTIDGNTIGRKRIITFPSASLSKIMLIIKSQKSPTSVAGIEGYRIPEYLLEQISQ